MITLKGIVHKYGGIEFSKEDNPWAFQRMDDGLKSGQERRIVFRPEVAPIELNVSSKISEEDIPWLERIRALLSTADKVYLQKAENLLQFRQAVHETGENQYLITLGSQVEIDDYAAENWKQASFFYASKHDGFRFDMTTLTVDETLVPTSKMDKVEVISRLVTSETPDEPLSVPTVMFDATGSTASVHVVSWRSSVKEGEIGRFDQEDTYISMTVPDCYKEPFVFCSDYRKTLKKRNYVFAGEKLELRLKKIMRKKKTMSKSSG